MTKHVVNFSGGACSFWTLHRVIEAVGKSNVIPLFADVKKEAKDLYRFLADTEKYFGIQITRVSRGLTPWELFHKEGMIGNSRAPICSVRLKRELLAEWHRENCLEMTTIIYVGLDWTEGHRLRDLRAQKPTWRIEAPMSEEPFWDKCRMVDELRKIGIAPSDSYELGFPHDNCAGACVKAGQAQWALLLKVRPEIYAENEMEEEKFRAPSELHPEGRNYSILSDRRGDGKKKPLPLKVFRERIEAGESFDRHDWGGCGCALDSSTTPANDQ